jgi:hypothetical protein
MTCIDSTYLKEQRDKWKTILDTAMATLETLAAENIRSYDLESDGGRQRATEKDLDKVNRQIDIATRYYEYYCNRLAGKGIGFMKLRRKP